jgi:predicted methyltransferase
MNHARRRVAVGWIALLSIPILSWAQVADDSREKTERVSDVLSALQAQPGKRIADIGAGEGFYSLRIARAVGPTGRVTAVDVSEKHLEKLRHVFNRTRSPTSTSWSAQLMIHTVPRARSTQC